MSEIINRRDFLKITGALGGTFLLSSCGLVDRMRGKPETQLPLVEGAWSYRDGTLIIDLDRLPELEELGGAVRIEGEVLPEPILVVLGEDGNYYSFKNVCTHSGRMLDPIAGTMTLQCCSVSRSTFDYSGKVLSGPAEEPLTSYPLVVDGDDLLITIQGQ
jgi:Rieske Fe-S protein